MRHRRTDPARRPGGPATSPAALVTRLTRVERRLAELEARLEAVASAPPLETPPPRVQRPEAKERPRCPGCQLELPRGWKRATQCEWCGFVLAALRDKAAK